MADVAQPVLSKPPAGRPAWRRWTIVGGVAFAVIQTLEQFGAVPAGAATHAANVAQSVAALAALLGLYRHVAN